MATAMTAIPKDTKRGRSALSSLEATPFCSKNVGKLG